MLPEVPLQIDLFTGDSVDNRSREQRQRDHERELPQQTEMFSQREMAQFGVRVNPVMPLSPGRLVLISEDPRTEEEIEHDRIKQAEALTADLFSAAPEASPLPPPLIALDTPTSSVRETDQVFDQAENDPEVTAPIEPLPGQYAAYRELVQLAQERAATLAITPVSALSETISMSLAKLQAQRAGLTDTEITTALLIGDFRGKQQVEDLLSHPPIALAESKTTQQRSWDVPILWTNRSDMLKRRPDLTEKIERLPEDEVEAIAALVGQSLQEFYWIQLNVILSLHLDHDLHLTNPIHPSKRP